MAKGDLGEKPPPDDKPPPEVILSEKDRVVSLITAAVEEQIAAGKTPDLSRLFDAARVISGTVKVPEVKQCRQPDSPMFGAVAVRAGESRWGIMHPIQGGHWGNDKEVWYWDTICT